MGIIKSSVIYLVLSVSLFFNTQTAAKDTAESWKTTEEILLSIEDVLGEADERQIESLHAKIEHEEVLTDQEISLVLNAKELRAKLVNNETDYTELKLLNQVKGNSLMDNLVQLSKMCSEEIDLALFERLYQEHVSNLPEKTKTVVVEGAGTLGLFTALKLYLAGAKVIVLDKRNEVYQLKQIVRLDPKWVAELHYFMGTEFNKLLEEGNALMKPSGYVEIPLNILANMIKIRLAQMKSYLEDTKGDDHIQLLYEFELGKIYSPSAEGMQFVALAVGKVYDNQQFQFPFDMLVFAGGANDKLRDQYLSHAVDRTESRMYAVAVWDKASGVGVDKDAPENFKGAIKGVFSSMIKEHINLKQFVAVKDFKELNKGDPDIEYRFFQNAGEVYIGIQYPQALQNIVEDLEELPSKKGVSAKKKDQVHGLAEKFEDAIRNEVLQKLGIDLGKTVIDSKTGETVPAYKLDKKNSTRFIVTQKAVDSSARIMETQGTKVYFAVVGDALVAPHFFSGSGLSSGREGINNLAATVKAVHAGADDVGAIAELNEKQQQVIQYALNKGKPFCPHLESAEVERRRYELNNKEIDGWVKKKDQQLKQGGDFSVKEKGAEYHLRYMDAITEEELEVVFGTHVGGLYIISHDAGVPLTSDQYILMHDLLRDLGVNY